MEASLCRFCQNLRKAEKKFEKNLKMEGKHGSKGAISTLFRRFGWYNF